MVTEQSGSDLELNRQSGISMLLIIGILVMAAILISIGDSTENEQVYQLALLCPVLTILLGIYTFTYRGKAFLLSRIVFFILLALSMFSLFSLWYLIELGKAYAH